MTAGIAAGMGYLRSQKEKEFQEELAKVSNSNKQTRHITVKLEIPENKILLKCHATFLQNRDVDSLAECHRRFNEKDNNKV